MVVEPLFRPMAGEEPDEDEDDDDAVGMERSRGGVKMADAPIRFLTLSHQAFRKELEEVHRMAVEAAESGSYLRGVVDVIGRRLQFFKLAYEYHCAAEDEILFPKLGMAINNMASTFAMEYKRIVDEFSSLLHCLDVVGKESRDLKNLFPKLISSIGSIKSIICQHMLKEERQVFPLVLKQLSLKKQAKIIWQCMCIFPVTVLEDFMAWMASLLPPDEQIDLLVCMKTVIPKEEVLQKAVISWLHKEKPSPARACNVYRDGAHFLSGQASFGNSLGIYPDVYHFGEEEQSKKPFSIYSTSRENQIDGIRVWNSAITREFRKILLELYQLENSATSSNLSSLLVRLQFLADVLIFYSKALDQILYPMLRGLSKNGLPFPCRQLVDENEIGRLHCCLDEKLQCEFRLSNFLEGLRKEVELLVEDISKVFIYIEREVFSFIGKNCSHQMQQWLLHAVLKSMPFGLLRCTVLWFSGTLSNDQFKCILDGMNVQCPLANRPFSVLLHDWVHTGYVGRISLESLTKTLREIPIRGGYHTSVQIRVNPGFSDIELEIQALNKSSSMELMPNSSINDNVRICNPSPSLFKISEQLESGRVNHHILFPQMLSGTFPMLKQPAEYGTVKNVLTLDSELVDHLACFCNALIRDLSHIVSLSADLYKCFQLFPDLKRHFELLKFVYNIHSDSKNTVVFPALESKGKQNYITLSYTLDQKLDFEQFKKVSVIVDEISNLPESPVTMGQTNRRYHHLCLKLHDTCLSLQQVISEHIHRQETELWPLLAEYFSIEEQEKIIGNMLGRTKSETLIEIIPWLMALLMEDEWRGLISLWLKATKNTNFCQWLGEWCEGLQNYSVPKNKEGSSYPPTFAAVPVEVVLTYLGEQSGKFEGKCNINEIKLSEDNVADHTFEQSRSLILHWQDPKNGENADKHYGLAKHSEETDVERGKNIVACTDQAYKVRLDFEVCHRDQLFALNQKDLETAIRRISRDPALDSQKKSHIMQSLIMSHWIVTQRKSEMISVAHYKEDLYPSYRDSLNLIFGCKHYKRNCKLLLPCCKKLFTCIRCHEDLTDHDVDRKTITKMMCMKCLVIQQIGPNCSNPVCNNFSMAKYYCRICKLFDDERQIYHCPYCNLCRVGKGLGIDYFHCMKCNACMSRALYLHACREKCLEENCPICHEDLFTSNSPVKALPCGHIMHSSCFQEYTFSHYTCPICSKSLGDMQVYFGMLDAILAEEKIPEEYSRQTQAILCNDCQFRGTTSFHWLYHKCPHCGSYNTRLI